jgi:hypothetical protein
VIEIMSVMIRLPMAIFVYSVEMFAATLQGVQRLSNESMDRLVEQLDPAVERPAPAPTPWSEPWSDPWSDLSGALAGTTSAPAAISAVPALAAPAVMPAAPAPSVSDSVPAAPAETLNTATTGASDRAETRSKEDRPMRDTNLADDMVKLVRYSILSIQRDDEHVLGEISANSGGRSAKSNEEREKAAMAIATGAKAQGTMPVARGEIVVTENMTDEAFSAWMISNYFEQANHEEVAVDDRKYLRVCYEVVGRWPAQDRRYEEYQLKFLGGIEEALSKIAASK